MLPETEFVKMADLLELGFSKETVMKVITVGALPRRVLPGCRYSHFLRTDVVRVFGIKEKKK